jgi:hypothetical protein
VRSRSLIPKLSVAGPEDFRLTADAARGAVCDEAAALGGRKPGRLREVPDDVFHRGDGR